MALFQPGGAEAGLEHYLGTPFYPELTPDAASITGDGHAIDNATASLEVYVVNKLQYKIKFKFIHLFYLLIFWNVYL